jgi:hypothetical protein
MRYRVSFTRIRYYIFRSAGSTPTNKGDKERSGSTHLT